MKNANTPEGLAIVLSLDKLTANQRTAYDLAVTMKTNMDGLADSYRQFCRFAKDNLLPKETNDVLILAGFRPDQASRIKTVASLPDELFKPYESKEISFNVALDRARDVKAKKKGKGRVQKLAKNMPIWKAAAKVVAKHPDYGFCELVNRSHVLIMLPFKAAVEKEFLKDGVKVVVAVLPKNKQTKDN